MTMSKRRAAALSTAILSAVGAGRRPPPVAA
ncbi:MAG: hypothetical protein JWR27_293 [Aeromicrobium sp.]|nr:hypothetical protein [Marmoricola sp.]MCW2768860.1 hypothetical protein [Aeromicrobium sp.]